MASTYFPFIQPPEVPYGEAQEVRIGESIIPLGEAFADPGHTVQIIADQQEPVVFLWDQDNVLLVDTFPATGYDTQPAEVVSVEYRFDTSGYTVGYYRLMFLFDVIGDDGDRRRMEPVILLRLHA